MRLIYSLMFFPFISFAASHIRHASLSQEEIATVRTATGIATIVQVPDRPNSIVVGDQAAFKVEYLDQAITIKPLRPAAKSNLYIYTDYRRFNVQLVTGAESVADYVVYLDSPKPNPEKSSVRWWNLSRSLITERLRVSVNRAAKTRDGVLLLELALSSDHHEKLDPKWFWLTQNGTTRPIQNLFLSSLELSPGTTATATIEILQSDVDENDPLRIEVRRKKTASLTIPKVTAWKQKGLP